MLSEVLTVVGCERVNQICYWAPYSATVVFSIGSVPPNRDDYTVGGGHYMINMIPWLMVFLER